MKYHTLVKISTNRRTGRVHARVNNKVVKHHEACIVINKMRARGRSYWSNPTSDETHNREVYKFQYIFYLRIIQK